MNLWLALLGAALFGFGGIATFRWWGPLAFALIDPDYWRHP